jgi:orotidine-5'-phosphate decarboxylase
LTEGSRQHFADRLAALVEERRSRVVLGLDPDPALLWPAAVDRARGEGLGDVEAATARAVSLHCQAAIAAAGPACVAVKLQLACFERIGGWTEIDEVASFARGRGLLVIADAKRGDVPVTARAYAQAFLGETPGPFGLMRGLGVDALTVNPLLGRDSLEPFVEAAAAGGAGIFSLVRTSNPGAAELQDGGDPPLRERLARMVDELGAPYVGECGLSCVGAVVGATEPRLLGSLRELLPRAILLLPGVGTQGGRVDELGPAVGPHPAAALVTASRSIVDAHVETGQDPASAATAAAEALRAAAWRLR